jgi:hypothetical protein
MARALGFTLLGMIMCVCALECALRALPVSTSTAAGYYIDPLILTYPPHFPVTFSTGWDLANAHRLRTNNYGFLVSRDFVPDRRAIALVGDSFVEANMLAEPDRLGGRLERSDGGRPVYALGAPGSSLLDFGERVRFAYDALDVRDFVIVLDRADVPLALCGSGSIHGRCLDPESLADRIERGGAPGLLKRVLRHSALMQYLVSQLKLTPGSVLERIRGAGGATPPVDRPRMAPERMPPALFDRVVEDFFERTAPYRKGRMVFVLDCDRDAIYAGREPVNPLWERFEALARAHGAAVIDTQPIFSEFWRATRLKLDVSPTDKHWNAEGNRLVAAAVAHEFAREAAAANPPASAPRAAL